MYQFYEKRFDFTLKIMHTKGFSYKLQISFKLIDYFREKFFFHFLLSYTKKDKIYFLLCNIFDLRKVRIG